MKLSNDNTCKPMKSVSLLMLDPSSSDMDWIGLRSQLKFIKDSSQFLKQSSCDIPETSATPVALVTQTVTTQHFKKQLEYLSTKVLNGIQLNSPGSYDLPMTPAELANQLVQLNEGFKNAELTVQEERNQVVLSDDDKSNDEKIELRAWRMQLIETEWKLHQFISKLMQREEVVKKKEMELISCLHKWAQAISSTQKIPIIPNKMLSDPHEFSGKICGGFPTIAGNLHEIEKWIDTIKDCTCLIQSSQPMTLDTDSTSLNSKTAPSRQFQMASSPASLQENASNCEEIQVQKEELQNYFSSFPLKRTSGVEHRNFSEHSIGYEKPNKFFEGRNHAVKKTKKVQNSDNPEEIPNDLSSSEETVQLASEDVEKNNCSTSDLNVSRKDQETSVTKTGGDDIAVTLVSAFREIRKAILKALEGSAVPKASEPQLLPELLDYMHYIMTSTIQKMKGDHTEITDDPQLTLEEWFTEKNTTFEVVEKQSILKDVEKNRNEQQPNTFTYSTCDRASQKFNYIDKVHMMNLDICDPYTSENDDNETIENTKVGGCCMLALYQRLRGRRVCFRRKRKVN